MSDRDADKRDYRELCASEPSIPLLAMDWWLDAVCGPDAWDVALARGKQEIVGSLPYYSLDVLGGRQIVQPRITPTLGAWVRYPPGQKYERRLGHELKVLTELIDALPEFDFFSQIFHPSLTNWLPFMWKGFTQTTHYTYVIEDLSDLDALFKDFKNTVRTYIRKASEQVEVRTGGSVDDLYRLIEKTWRRQGRPVPFTLGFLRRVDDALEKHGRREIFIAVDPEGRPHSGMLLTWDATAAYVHLVGEDEELRGSGAGKLVVWEAIQYTARKLGLPRFDFLGSVVEGIEPVRRSFAARQVPIFVIRKDNRTLARRLLQRAVSRFRPDLAAPRSD